MSSLFGEVVYPSSRAFWSEEDDDTQENIDNSSIFKIDIKDITTINSLIVIETDLLTDFIKESVLNKSEIVGTITRPSASGCTSTLYALTGDIYILLVGAVDLATSGVFVDAISGLLEKAKDIVALTSNHVSQLKTKINEESPSFLRLLSTKKAKDVMKDVPRLNQPNIVSGVAAGVISYAEVMNKSGVLYIIYLDSFSLDSSTASPLLKLLPNLTKSSLPLLSPSFSSFNKGNLYMYFKSLYSSLNNPYQKLTITFTIIIIIIIKLKIKTTT
ncbi:proteasome assembly chaperone 1 [Cotesia typhae]|uniref:proteasome assembly chaperone 1 n=1 Tax=Cotesia typhae TaxID=2053667 RepID=UPI003D6905AF